MKERYRKVLVEKLDAYLPSDLATQMLEADLGGKPPVVFFKVHLQNCEKQLLALSCLAGWLSVYPHGTTRLPLDRF
jgi:hypothetical protein